MRTQLESHDGLLIVDVQNDFLRKGSLPVPMAEDVIPVINAYVDLFSGYSLPIFASRDWHPENHCSFIEQGGAWPPHCVAGTAGAAFPPALILPAFTRILSKADQQERESYSAFEGTGLAELLAISSVSRIFVCGLATDFCVLHTVRDARQKQFDVVLLTDAVRAVDGEGGRLAIEEMQSLGVVQCTLTELR